MYGNIWWHMMTYDNLWWHMMTSDNVTYGNDITFQVFNTCISTAGLLRFTLRGSASRALVGALSRWTSVSTLQWHTWWACFKNAKDMRIKKRKDHINIHKSSNIIQSSNRSVDIAKTWNYYKSFVRQWVTGCFKVWWCLAANIGVWRKATEEIWSYNSQVTVIPCIPSCLAGYGWTPRSGAVGLVDWHTFRGSETWYCWLFIPPWCHSRTQPPSLKVESPFSGMPRSPILLGQWNP